jgi:hypothetical protein
MNHLVESIVYDNIWDYSDEDTEDEEDRLVKEELETIRKRVEKQEREIEALMVRKEKRRKDRLRYEQQRSELLQREKDVLQNRSSKSVAFELPDLGSPQHLPTIGGHTVATGYVYVVELGKLVHVPTMSSYLQSSCNKMMAPSPVHSLSNLDASADSDCPVSPSPGNICMEERQLR